MNVMWCAGNFDEDTWQFLNMLQLTPSFLNSYSHGMAAVEQGISYLQELHAGDIIAVRSWLLDVQEKSLVFVHQMTHDETDTIEARTKLTAVYMDTKTRKSCAFPKNITAAAKSFLEKRFA
jgi:acyl-CoA thioester hydrolase